jgi:hypothetical protein
MFMIMRMETTMKYAKDGILSLALGVAFVAGLVSDSGSANAATRRVHATACHYFYDNAGTEVYQGAWLGNQGNTTRGIYCNAPSDSTLSHSGTITLNVHGFEPSGGSNTSQACVKFYNAAGTSCGTSRSWSTAYGGVFGVSVSAWTANPAGMPYVYNSIAAGGQVFGFYMAS